VIPDMKPAEVRVIEDELRLFAARRPLAVMEILEWGAGGSTVYFSSFLEKLGVKCRWVAVEYSRKWAGAVRAAVGPAVHIELFDVGNDEQAQRYMEMDSFVSYPATLGRRFHFILVDGRKRRRCLLEALKLVREDGVVYLHDAHRRYYRCALAEYPSGEFITPRLWRGSLQRRIDVTEKPAKAKKDKGRKAVEKKAQALQRLTVEYVSAAAVRPNSYNPNRQSDHDFYLLILSMLEDGFTQPIIVQKQTKEIVDGEHRWTGAIVMDAIKQQKLEVRGADGEQVVAALRHRRAELIRPEMQLPVVMVDMTPEQMRIATLRHNRARGSEDMELTAQVLRDLRELGALEWAQDSLQLDDVELQRLLEDVQAPEALAGETFSEGWAPDAAHANSGEGKGSNMSLTPEALARMREQEKKIAEAKTEEEKAAAQRDIDIYRLALVFSGEEAKVVKMTLGDRPAERVLAMCRSVAVVPG